MWGGALLLVAGTWVLTQVFGGNALGRLGIAGSPSQVTPNPTTGAGGGATYRPR